MTFYRGDMKISRWSPSMNPTIIKKTSGNDKIISNTIRELPVADTIFSIIFCTSDNSKIEMIYSLML